MRHAAENPDVSGLFFYRFVPRVEVVTLESGVTINLLYLPDRVKYKVADVMQFEEANSRSLEEHDTRRCPCCIPNMPSLQIIRNNITYQGRRYYLAHEVGRFSSEHAFFASMDPLAQKIVSIEQIKDFVRFMAGMGDGYEAIFSGLDTQRKSLAHRHYHWQFFKTVTMVWENYAKGTLKTEPISTVSATTTFVERSLNWICPLTIIRGEDIEEVGKILLAHIMRIEEDGRIPGINFKVMNGEFVFILAAPKDGQPAFIKSIDPQSHFKIGTAEQAGYLIIESERLFSELKADPKLITQIFDHAGSGQDLVAHNNPLVNEDLVAVKGDEKPYLQGKLEIKEDREGGASVTLRWEANAKGINLEELNSALVLLAAHYTEQASEDEPVFTCEIPVRVVQGFAQPVYMRRVGGVIEISLAAFSLEAVALALLLNHETYSDEFSALGADLVFWQWLNDAEISNWRESFQDRQDDAYLKFLNETCGLLGWERYKSIIRFIVWQSVQRAKELPTQSNARVVGNLLSSLEMVFPLWGWGEIYREEKTALRKVEKLLEEEDFRNIDFGSARPVCNAMATLGIVKVSDSHWSPFENKGLHHPGWGENLRPSFAIKPEDVMVLHKKAGMTFRRNRPNSIWDSLPADWKNAYLLTMADPLREGVVVLTRNPELIDFLRKNKGIADPALTYQVTLKAQADERSIEQMKKGTLVRLDSLQGQEAVMFVKPTDIGTGIKVSDEKPQATMQMTVPESMERHVPYLMQDLNIPVVQSVVIRYLNIELGDLKPGEFRRASWQELKGILSNFEIESSGKGYLSEQQQQIAEEEMVDRQLIDIFLRDEIFIRDVFDNIFARTDLGRNDIRTWDIRHIGEGGFRRVYSVRLQLHEEEDGFVFVIKIVKPEVVRSDSGYAYDKDYTAKIHEITKGLREKFLFAHPPVSRPYSHQDTKGRLRLISAEGYIEPTEAILEDTTKDRLMIRSYLMLYQAFSGQVFVRDPKRPNVYIRRISRSVWQGTLIDLDNITFGNISSADMIADLMMFGFKPMDIIVVFVDTLGTAKAEEIFRFAQGLLKYKLTNSDEFVDALEQYKMTPRESIDAPVMTSSIGITLNGLKQTVPQGTTLYAVLTDRYVNLRNVTVDLNGDIKSINENGSLKIKKLKNLYQDILKDGDEIEFYYGQEAGVPSLQVAPIEMTPAQKRFFDEADAKGLKKELEGLKSSLEDFLRRTISYVGEENSRLKAFRQANQRVQRRIGSFVADNSSHEDEHPITGEMMASIERTFKRVDFANDGTRLQLQETLATLIAQAEKIKEGLQQSGQEPVKNSEAKSGMVSAIVGIASVFLLSGCGKEDFARSHVSNLGALFGAMSLIGLAMGLGLMLWRARPGPLAGFSVEELAHRNCVFEALVELQAPSADILRFASRLRPSQIKSAEGNRFLIKASSLKHLKKLVSKEEIERLRFKKMYSTGIWHAFITKHWTDAPWTIESLLLCYQNDWVGASEKIVLAISKEKDSEKKRGRSLLELIFSILFLGGMILFVMILMKSIRKKCLAFRLPVAATVLYRAFLTSTQPALLASVVRYKEGWRNRFFNKVPVRVEVKENGKYPFVPKALFPIFNSTGILIVLYIILPYWAIFNWLVTRLLFFSVIIVCVNVIKVIIKVKERRVLLPEIFKEMFLTVFTVDIDVEVSSYQYRMLV